MTTLIEEMRLAVLELWQSLGFERSSRTAAAVVPALLLGIALNMLALGVVGNVHMGRHASCEKIGLGSVARSEMMMVRTAMTSTMKKMWEQQRGLCLAKRWVLDWKAGTTCSEMSCSRSAHIRTKGVALHCTVALPDRFGHCNRSVQSAA